MLRPMEPPPTCPPTKPPLGAQFYVLLLTPLVFLVLTMCCINSKDLAGPLLWLAGLATLACSIILARQLSRRVSKTGESTVGMSILMFLALQAFYGVCFFVGCTATLMIA